jgi:membrane fusion protein (multidrug efflux system)
MKSQTDLPENVGNGEPVLDAASGPRTAPPVRKRNRLRWLVVSILLVAAGVWLADFVQHALRYEDTDDAYVTGHVHQVSSQVDGRVKDVCVQDNQLVKAGDVLVRLDPLEFEIALQKAQANSAQAGAQEAQARAAASQAEAQLAEAEAHEAQAEAQVRQTGAQLELARRNQARNEQLFKKDNGVIAKADLDATQGAFDSTQAADDAANANLKAARAAIASAKAMREAAEAQQAAAHAGLTAGEAAVREADRKLSHTIIAASAAGRIGNKNVEPGNRVQAGQNLLALVEPEVWVVANFKETQLAKMHPGQPVDVSIDALSGETFQGTIDSLAPASGAQFALLPADNATGNFTKVVQRVPVKIIFAPEIIRKLADRLRPGLSTIVNVRVR